MISLLFNTIFVFLLLPFLFFLITVVELIRLQYKTKYLSRFLDFLQYYFVSSFPTILILSILFFLFIYFFDKFVLYLKSKSIQFKLSSFLLFFFFWNIIFYQWNIQLVGFGSYFYTAPLLLLTAVGFKFIFWKSENKYKTALFVFALSSLFLLKQNQSLIQLGMRKESYQFLLPVVSLLLFLTLFLFIFFLVNKFSNKIIDNSKFKKIEFILALLATYLLYFRLISVKIYLAQYRFWILLEYIFLAYFFFTQIFSLDYFHKGSDLKDTAISKKKFTYLQILFIVSFLIFYLSMLNSNLKFSRSYYFRKYPSVINLSLPFRYFFDSDRDGYLSILGENDPDNDNFKITPLSKRPKGEAKVQLANISEYKNLLIHNKNIPYIDLKKKKYNILALSIDAWRADRFHFSQPQLRKHKDLKFLHYKKNIIPNINRLVKRSIFFTGVYTPYPRTNPAIIAFAYGAYSYSRPNLKRSMFSYFKSNGYRIKFLAGATQHYKYSHKYIPEFKGAYGKKNKKSDYKSYQTTKRIEKELEKKSPSFVWAHFMEPHIGYIKHKKFDFGNSRKQRYNSELAYVDYYIGKLLKRLEDKGILKNTIVLFFADHGENLGEENLYGHSLWLRPESVHIPFLIVPPKIENIKETIFVEDRIGITDIMPFMVQHWLQVKLDNPYKGKIFNTRSFYLKSDIDLGVIEGDYLLILNSLFPGIYGFSKMPQYMELKLYNIKNNPFSKKDLSDKYPILTWDIYNRNKAFFESISKRRTRVSFK